MNKNTFWQIAGVGALAIVLLASISFSINQPGADPESSVQDPTTAPAYITIEGIYRDQEVPVRTDETALSMLEKLAAGEDGFNLQTEEYAGLGTLVTGIGDTLNGSDDKYWQYKVNGVMPEISADKMKVRAGDTIEWFFGQSEF